MLKRRFDPELVYYVVLYLRMSTILQSERSPEQQQNEIEKRLEEFLEAYNDYEGANGAWISGFFGSGKSHTSRIDPPKAARRSSIRPLLSGIPLLGAISRTVIPLMKIICV